MSGNRQYRSEFNKKAGDPADFDTLFGFNENELTIKRRIRIKSNKKRIAAMTSSVAVITAAVIFGLSYINMSGTDNQGISELADINTEALSEYMTDEMADVSGCRLSELTDMFDYSYYEQNNSLRSSSDYSFESLYGETADAVIRARVVKKTYLSESAAYILLPEECYIKTQLNERADVSEEWLNRYIEVTVPLNNYTRELQPGSEYILPLVYSDEGLFSVPESYSPIRMTERGWLFDAYGNDVISYNTVKVEDDMGAYEMLLEESVSSMTGKLKQFFESRSESYYYYSFEENPQSTHFGTYNIFDFGSDFEKNGCLGDIGYLADQSGSSDKKTVVLKGFSSIGLNTELTGNINEDDLYFNKDIFIISLADGKTLLIKGISSYEFTEISDHINVTLSCNDSVYVRLVDNCGQIMNFELEKHEKDIYCTVSEADAEHIVVSALVSEDDKYFYSNSDCKLEKKTNDGWTPLEKKKNSVPYAEFENKISLKKYDINSFYFDITEKYEPLTKGTYRLIKDLGANTVNVYFDIEED